MPVSFRVSCLLSDLSFLKVRPFLPVFFSSSSALSYWTKPWRLALDEAFYILSFSTISPNLTSIMSPFWQNRRPLSKYHLDAPHEGHLSPLENLCSFRNSDIFDLV